MAHIPKALRLALADEQVARYFKRLERELVERVRLARVEQQTQHGVIALQITKVIQHPSGIVIRVR